jgi:hypothetical protein
MSYCADAIGADMAIAELKAISPSCLLFLVILLSALFKWFSMHQDKSSYKYFCGVVVKGNFPDALSYMEIINLSF